VRPYSSALLSSSSTAQSTNTRSVGDRWRLCGQTADIGSDKDKKFVMVVDAQNKAQYREVRTGKLHDGLRVIGRGMQPGERVIVNGLQRARPNDTVRVKLVAMSGATSASVAAAPAPASTAAKSAEAGS
jgi:multidrug efflux pump subunit AcrA (membrane-fusion protein)